MHAAATEVPFRIRAACDTEYGSHRPAVGMLILRRLKAGMAELADAADSKSADPCGHGGSTPPPGTNKTKDLS